MPIVLLNKIENFVQ